MSLHDTARVLTRMVLFNVVIIGFSLCQIDAFQSRHSVWTAIHRRGSIRGSILLSQHGDAVQHFMTRCSAAVDESSSVQDSKTDTSAGNRRHFLRIAGLSMCSLSSMTPIDAASAKVKTLSPQQSLVETRDRLDLVVQASSVQAWTEATEIASDELLNIEVLTKAFDRVTSESTTTAANSGGGGDGAEVAVAVRLNEYRDTCIAGVGDLREALSRSKPMTTESAMDVMRFGTSSRVAMDSFLGAIDDLKK